MAIWPSGHLATWPGGHLTGHFGLVEFGVIDEVVEVDEIDEFEEYILSCQSSHSSLQDQAKPTSCGLTLGLSRDHVLP